MYIYILHSTECTYNCNHTKDNLLHIHFMLIDIRKLIRS